MDESGMGKEHGDDNNIIDYIFIAVLAVFMVVIYLWSQ